MRQDLSRFERSVIKLMFRTKRDFIKEAQGILSNEVIEYGKQQIYSSRKLTDEEREIRKKVIFQRINNLMIQHGYDKNLEVPKDLELRINDLVSRSQFTKNRRKKLSNFIIHLFRWNSYIRNLTEEQLVMYDAIYWGAYEYISKGLTPLPYVLMGRWASDHVPMRISLVRFKFDIIDKLPSDDLRNIMEYFYKFDDSGENIILKKGLSDKDLNLLKKILDSIGYINSSSTKYKIFLDYLIKESIVEQIVNYSTHGRCKYYRVNL